MIISHGRRYIFVHAPKTGGTSMTLALEARAKADDIIIGDTPNAKQRRKRLAGSHPRGVCGNTAPCAILMGLWMHPQCKIISSLPSCATRGTAWSAIITGRANRVLIIPLFRRRLSMTLQSFCVTPMFGVHYRRPRITVMCRSHLVQIIAICMCAWNI